MDMPEIRINLFECDDPAGTYGAKSVGEPATECVAAAIANAVCNATGQANPPATPRASKTSLLGKKALVREARESDAKVVHLSSSRALALRSDRACFRGHAGR